MPKFSILTLLLATTIFGLTVSLIFTNKRLAQKSSQLDSLLSEVRHLNIEDDNEIHVVNIPGFGENSWRWRIFLPNDRQFRLRSAYNNVPKLSLPSNPPDNYRCALPSGEFILTATIHESDGKWMLTFNAERNGNSKLTYKTNVRAKNTRWLEQSSGNPTYLAGQFESVARTPDKPFILLSHRNGFRPTPNTFTSDPNPTDGVMIWIQENE